jgi:IS30 family transposase
MTYHQITSEERYTLAALRKQGVTAAQIAKTLGRHRSTIYRELERNTCADGGYRLEKAQKRANGRRRRSRQRPRFEREDWQVVRHWLVREQWSPKQIAGTGRLWGWLNISHETIYRHIYRDRERGGLLYTHLRHSTKRRRKRYRSYDSRGRLAGKKLIEMRPEAVERRQEIGHWEIDTVMGHGSQDCIVTLVERVTGFVLIGKLDDRTAEGLTRRVVMLIRRYPWLFKTITADNGTEFHDYASIEEATGVQIFFAKPYHSWERGTNENTNGLIRQYLPKRRSMQTLTQEQCDAIADKLNNRPRERHGFRSPLERLLDTQ